MKIKDEKIKKVEKLLIVIGIIALGLGVSMAPIFARTPVKEIKAGFIYIGPVGDAGWTTAHDRGRKALEKLPFVAKTSYVESVPEGADALRVLTDYIHQGYNLIFATSYGYMDQTLEVANKYPKVIFEHCSGYKTAVNMSNYFGRIYQPDYLCGLIAGMMTKNNTIGYVGPYPIPEVIRGINAFTLGVRAVNPKAVVKVVWTYTWFDPAKEKTAAESLLGVDCDIIATGQDSPGPLQAAAEKGKYCFGYNMDMKRYAPDYYLTAPVWDWGVFYKKIAKEVHDGTWTNKPIWWGMETGLVSLSPYGPRVPAEVKARVDDARKLIVAGKLKVFMGPVRGQDGKVVIPEGSTPTDKELFSMSYFVEGVKGEIPK